MADGVKVPASGEDLLEPTRVRVYGRIFEALEVKKNKISTAGGSGLLRQALERLAKDESDPKIARIYAFSYGGDYYKLARPCLLIVEGPGKTNLEGNVIADRRSAPSTIDDWGVESKFERFADDVRAWDLDREDLTMRFDVDGGFVRDILISPSGAEDVDLVARSSLVGRASSFVARSSVVGPGDMSARSSVVGPEMMARHRFRG